MAPLENGIREVVTAGGAKAGGVAPSPRVPVSAGGATAGGVGPAEVIAPAVVVAYAVVAQDGYHLAADHHDLVAYGTELVLVLCLIFVGGRLVAGRRFRSSA